MNDEQVNNIIELAFETLEVILKRKKKDFNKQRKILFKPAPKAEPTIVAIE